MQFQHGIICVKPSVSMENVPPPAMREQRIKAAVDLLRYIPVRRPAGLLACAADQSPRNCW